MSNTQTRIIRLSANGRTEPRLDRRTIHDLLARLGSPRDDDDSRRATPAETDLGVELRSTSWVSTWDDPLTVREARRRLVAADEALPWTEDEMATHIARTLNERRPMLWSLISRKRGVGAEGVLVELPEPMPDEIMVPNRCGDHVRWTATLVKRALAGEEPWHDEIA